MCIGGFLFLAFLSNAATAAIGIFNGDVLFSFLLSGIVYTGAVAILIIFFPAVIGLYKKDLKTVYYKTLSLL